MLHRRHTARDVGDYLDSVSWSFGDFDFRRNESKDERLDATPVLYSSLGRKACVDAVVLSWVFCADGCSGMFRDIGGRRWTLVGVPYL